MKKKMLCLLTSIMVIGMLGCGNKNDADSQESKATETATETQTQTQETSGEETTSTAISAIENLDEIVVLNDYKSMTVTVAKNEATDEAVIEYINNRLLSTFEITGRAVENGDIAVIDFTGYKDGEAFDGGTATDYQLQIGSGSFIEGFEEGLVGVNPGETVDLNLTFPENYGSEDLAGQDVVFTVTVKGILATTTYEELTDEQLVLMGIGYSTKDELWNAAKEALISEYEESYNNEIVNAALDVILQEASFKSVPAYLVDESLDAYMEYSEMACSYYYQIDLETYVNTYFNMTIDEYKESMREECENEVKQSLAIEAIGRAEGLVPTEEEILKEAQEYVDTYGYESVEELYEAGGGKDSFVSYLTQTRVLEYLQNNVKVETVNE